MITKIKLTKKEALYALICCIIHNDCTNCPADNKDQYCKDILYQNVCRLMGSEKEEEPTAESNLSIKTLEKASAAMERAENSILDIYNNQLNGKMQQAFDLGENFADLKHARSELENECINLQTAKQK